VLIIARNATGPLCSERTTHPSAFLTAMCLLKYVLNCAQRYSVWPFSVSKFQGASPNVRINCNRITEVYSISLRANGGQCRRCFGLTFCCQLQGGSASFCLNVYNSVLKCKRGGETRRGERRGGKWWQKGIHIYIEVHQTTQWNPEYGYIT
jgi:hypothetical protein